ncbi:hypothetical protein CEXT_518991 [Caerostris extrusa]|uniref:Uncharacterized protein n=1 Tax=Caerostris extrusa TaxID=172846 RepID=A0AAV4WTV4_CAEEX|nr:hypothetical protein CEXT_518991 [Caerostris extrusa]
MTPRYSQIFIHTSLIQNIQILILLCKSTCSKDCCTKLKRIKTKVYEFVERACVRQPEHPQSIIVHIPLRLSGIDTRPCPTRSPDFLSIERVWYIVDTNNN